MTLLPKVKLHALVSFPATVLDGTGVDVVKTNGTYQFNLDFGDFAPPAAAVTDTAQQNALLWNANTGAYTLVPMSVFATLPGAALPLINGTATVGISTLYSREDHIHPTDTSRAPLASPTFTGDPKAPTPTLGDNDTSIATTAFVTASLGAIPLRGYLSGLTLSTAGASTTFGIAAGVATDNGNVVLMSLASAYTKTTAAWAVGTAAGSLDTGAIANSTWYYVYLIRRTDTGVVDVLISLSATTPTLPASYTQFRRIGAMKTDGSGQWTLFIQLGDEYIWSTPVSDVNTTISTTPTLFPLTVPAGIQVIARIRGLMSHASANTSLLLTSPAEASAAVGAVTGNRTVSNPVAGSSSGALFTLDVRTDTSAQVRAVSNASSTTIQITTYGWIDRRGRDA